MKKLIAILLTLCVLCTSAAVFAEEEPFTFRNGITFGMSLNDVIAAETARYYELDTEHTWGRVNFTELEYENVTENNVRADLKYLFESDKLVAIRVNYETRDIRFEQVKADLEEKFGKSAAVDMVALGKGIYAVDDDGRLELNAEAIICGDLMIVLELDADDIDVTFVDLNAA